MDLFEVGSLYQLCAVQDSWLLKHSTNRLCIPNWEQLCFCTVHTCEPVVLGRCPGKMCQRRFINCILAGNHSECCNREYWYI